ncbi:MAG: tetratricopeptide repeat protein [Pyrinomonadaceae bacterium]|nr:tetratricopeptide repeat protein [Pyrinomonadaceae bacterium]
MKLIRPIGTVLVVGTAALALNAQTADEHLQRCDAAYGKAKYADAVKHCTKAIESRPGFEEALITRAAAHKNLGNNDAAIDDYTELIRVTSGMAMAYFYRAGIFQKLGRNNDAIADLTASITKEPKGLFAARSYYQRGQLYDKLGKGDDAQSDYGNAVKLKPDYAEAKARIKYPFGDLTITEAANRIIPGITTPDRDAPAKPGPLPTPVVAVKPSTTPPSAASVTIPSTWKRMVLTGTGVSVASPVPYVLKNDKPDPLLEAMEANVDWDMTDGGLWATVRYQKWDQKFAKVRDVLESTVNIIFDNPKAGAQFVKDTTFLGEAAAVVDQERFDTYDKKQVRQKMIVFGKPDDYTQLNFVHPAGDKVAAAKVDQIIASFKKEGTVVAAISKLPPTSWKTYNFGGLLFDFPAPPSPESCKSPAMPGSTKICGKWGDTDMSIDITYRNYGNSVVPQPSELAAQHLQFTKEIEADDTGYKDYQNTAFPINLGEAVKVTNTSAFSRTDTIFIRRGNETWQVSIWHFNRWDGVRDAVQHVLGSFKFKQ